MTTATVTPSKSGKPAKFRRDHKINWWLTAAVAVLRLTILIPLYFTIVTALKTPAEAGTFALPTSWQWHNFADASAKVNYPKAALNSAIITVAAVVLTLQVWCRNENYWDLQYDLNARIKPALDAKGIAIPYPQMDLHVKGPEQEG